MCGEDTQAGEEEEDTQRDQNFAKPVRRAQHYQTHGCGARSSFKDTQPYLRVCKQHRLQDPLSYFDRL